MPGHHTAKQKRQAKHIADSERKRGMSKKRAESVGWATVNKDMSEYGLATDAAATMAPSNPAPAPKSPPPPAPPKAPPPKTLSQPKPPAPTMKAFQVLSVDDYHNALRKDLGPSPAQAPAPAMPRRRPEKPTVKMKPITNAEASANLKAGKFHEKSLFELIDFLKAMEMMPKPPGPVGPPKTYLPGVHSPASPMRKQKKPKAAPAMAKASDCGPEPMKPDLAKKNSTKKSINQETTMSKNTYEDLFKSELGIDADKVLIDCPHCEHPITKSDVMNKAANEVVAENHGGGQHRGPASGHNKKTPKRPAGGVPKHGGGLPGAHTAKAMKKDDDDSSSDDASSGDADSVSKASTASAGPLIGGSEYVQYHRGNDEELAKAIAEGTLGQGGVISQPMDKNNSRTRNIG